jgi:ribose-phosphate pyrophosphokinase
LLSFRPTVLDHDTQNRSEMATNSIKLLTGNSHGQLAKLVADRLGIELAKIMVLQYSNNESSISIGESVRDEDGRPL